MIFVKISHNFIKSHLKICLISQISVHSLWRGIYMDFNLKINGQPIPITTLENESKNYGKMLK